MVSKGSSQNMGVFGIVNSHEARLMKPLGKPQKRSYSMPGKTGYPQSPWCLQYLAGDFQQKNWDDPHRPLFLGWVEVISHGRRISPWHGRWLLHDFPAEEYEICWWVFQSVVSVEYFWLSWQAYQKSPSVFGCFPPFNPTESITAQEKYQKPVSRIPLGCHRKGWNDLETYQVLLGMGICLRNLNECGNKKSIKEQATPINCWRSIIFKYIYRERERLYIYIYV